MKNKAPETRTFLCSVETRADEQRGTVIEGLPIVYGQETDLGWYKEVIERGALDKTDLRDVRFLVNHDTAQIPLARSRNNNENSTMQLSVTDEGLTIRADMDVEGNARAAELVSAVKRRDVSGMSFMFDVRGEEWENLDSDSPTRRITEIGTVYEVSAVTWPAYEQTSITARSLDSVRQSLESAREALESAKKTEELRQKIIERSKELCSKND